MAGNSNIRNPILVSYITKGLLPYKGIGSGGRRALDDWQKIDFIDDRDGCTFTVIVHRPEEKSSVKMSEIRLGDKLGDNEKMIFLLLAKNRKASITSVATSTGLSTTGVEKIISRLKGKGVLKRTGSAKGGYWEVLE